MASQHTTTLEGDTDSSSNPAMSTPHRHSSKTQDASTDIHSPRRDSGYESPSLPSTPHHRRSHTSKTNPNPPQQPINPPTMSTSRSSSRPTTSHRSPSTRSSLAHSTRRASNPTSRRSSFLLQPMPQASRTRPQLGSRAASENHLHLHLHHNPFLPHSSTFPATPKMPRQCSFPSPNHHLHSSSLPSPQPSYSNYLPAPPIDWTLPSTRRKDYEELDRHRRGLRGLWRKLVPRIYGGRRTGGFFDDEKEGGGSDASSVRRYRLDLQDGEKSERDDGDSGDTRPVLEGRRTTSGWGCWGIRRPPGKRQNV